MGWGRPRGEISFVISHLTPPPPGGEGRRVGVRFFLVFFQKQKKIDIFEAQFFFRFVGRKWKGTKNPIPSVHPGVFPKEGLFRRMINNDSFISRRLGGKWRDGPSPIFGEGVCMCVCARAAWIGRHPLPAPPGTPNTPSLRSFVVHSSDAASVPKNSRRR